MRPLENEDTEEFARRITAIAWSNGGFVEREACAQLCEDLWKDNYTAYACAEAIRARGEA